MSLLQKYRKDETRKKSDNDEQEEKDQDDKKPEKKPIAPKTVQKKKKGTTQSSRSRPVISATVPTNLVNALSDLTEEKYLNRSKFIEDALIRTIKTEFPDIAKRYDF